VLVHEVIGHDFEARRCTGLPLPRHVEPDTLIAAAKPQESFAFFSMVAQMETHVGKLGMGIGCFGAESISFQGYISFPPKRKLFYGERVS